MDRYIVLRDFSGLKKDDFITVTYNEYGVYFDKLNASRKFRFYGNDKGNWSKTNQRKKTEPKFVIREEVLYRLNVIKFYYYDFSIPHPTEEFKRMPNMSVIDYMNSIIKDYINLQIIKKY